MVYHYDGLVSSQIRKRFWPGFGARSACFDRLSRLVDAGYLRSVRLPASQGLGSGPSFVTIGERSHPLLKEQLGLTHSDLKRVRHSYIPMFWAHDRLVREIRLNLELACEESALVELSEWTTDASLKRQPIKVKLANKDGAVTETIELVPDGIFTLTRGDQTKRYYLEVDGGTLQSRTLFKRKIRAYLAHIGPRPHPVLYVVPDEARRRKLSRWIQAEAEACSANPKLFAIALKDELTQETVLHAPIWQVVGGPEALALLPESHCVQIQAEPQLSTHEWLELLYGKGVG